ncbi:MAG: aminoglycoside phosphotransferase family protein [Methanophagales archaeon ANME-1-THS]|nr:MAG: aminoglycoside phosphotransferase family protein [Methanophagales archaeon ANME-1-THS]
MNEELKEYLEQKFGTPVRIRSVKELGLGGTSKLIGEHELKGFGYGKPYLVEFETGGGKVQEVVISTMKGDSFGHEHFSDRAHILLWQYQAFNKLPKHVRALDVGYFTKDRRLKSAGDAEEYFIACEKVEGAEYVHDLTRLKEGGRVRDVDRERVSALASYLADIHAVKKDDPALYVRRLRELVGHSECIFGLTDSYPPGSAFITREDLMAIEKKSNDWRWKLKERTKRLCMVHGDFHPWNVMFREGVDFTVLDRSRGEWGEAADDVSSMMINYLFFGLLKTDGKELDEDFKGLFELFIAEYLKQTGDYELLEVIQPFYAFRGLVVASPIWYPNISLDTRRKLFNFIRNVLEEDEFDYKKVDGYLLKDR